MSIYDQFDEKERLILLERRKQRLSAEGTGAQQGETGTALHVHIRDEHYALPVETLTYVHVDVRVVAMPCVPAYIGGIANIRGHIIPVIDLAVLLNVPGDFTPEDNTLVVAANEESVVAFRVETIGEISTFLVEEVEPVPSPIESQHTGAYLQGILPGGAVLLDVAAILNDPDLVVTESV